MPKRKVRTPINNTQKILSALFRVRELHSPCASEQCKVEYRHCAGCNESFPCLTVHALEGTKPINHSISLFGDQYTGDSEQDDKAEIIYTEVKELGATQEEQESQETPENKE